jgi:hypothetical protein
MYIGKIDRIGSFRRPVPASAMERVRPSRRFDLNDFAMPLSGRMKRETRGNER